MKGMLSRSHKKFFWIAVAICSVIWTLLLWHNKHLGYYEAEASIYPMQMKNEGDSLSTVNPCSKVIRILSSSDFREEVIRNVACDRLTSRNYDHHIQCHETADHQVRMRVFLSDSSEALKVTVQMVQTVNRMFLQSPSTRIECNSDFREAFVKDYLQMAINGDSTSFMCCDIIDSPHLVRNPSVGAGILYFCLSFLFAMLVVGSLFLIVAAYKKTAL